MKSNLKQLRKEAGMTMQVLADKAGTSRGHIHALEKPRSNPGLLTAYSVADALNVNITDIWVSHDVWDKSNISEFSCL